jgi:hypothetical protein
MSFNRLNYDYCQYKQTLAETTGACNYMLGTPSVVCKSDCFVENPSIRLQKNGVSTISNKPLVDVDSELWNRVSPNTKCPNLKYLPDCPSDQIASSYIHPPQCSFTSGDDTRLTNPPSTLRGTGWNRWENLNRDPQLNALVPFDLNIQNRILVKDNHRPCIPSPLNPNPSLPIAMKGLECNKIIPTCEAPTYAAGVFIDDESSS